MQIDSERQKDREKCKVEEEDRHNKASGIVVDFVDLTCVDDDDTPTRSLRSRTAPL
jgi:hypothetical protein